MPDAFKQATRSIGGAFPIFSQNAAAEPLHEGHELVRFAEAGDRDVVRCGG
jgi:hypothetical protein